MTHGDLTRRHARDCHDGPPGRPAPTGSGNDADAPSAPPATAAGRPPSSAALPAGPLTIPHHVRPSQPVPMPAMQRQGSRTDPSERVKEYWPMSTQSAVVHIGSGRVSTRVHLQASQQLPQTCQTGSEQGHLNKTSACAH